jgi:hypothetical protein
MGDEHRMNHYHVSRHSDDEDPFVTGDLFAALDYARGELDSLADFEHDGVSFVAAKVEDARSWGDKRYPSAYEMEEALLSFAKVERYNGLMANAANIVKQHNYSKRADRAPIYRPAWENQGTNEADARLYKSAEHTAGEINSGSPIAISECEAELHTWPDNDQMHGGESYCADEYPDGYADDVALNTQDGPCGDL